MKTKSFIKSSYIVILIFFSISIGRLQAQSLIKTYVQQNTVPIKTIEPDASDYADLEVIGKAVGDAKIVMMGEQDHGDAPVFLAKTRLVKYLHEKKGFNVLAFESDFYALNDGWDKLKKERPLMDSFIRDNIFTVWARCHTCTPLLYNYLPATYASANPLILTGFDSQLVLAYSKKNLAHSIDSLIRHLNLPITKQKNYSTELRPLLDSSIMAGYNIVKLNYSLLKKTSKLLLTIQNQLAKVLPADNFWLYVVDNVLAAQYRSVPLRDVQMAQNLRWLNETKFKDQKIIVWAANFHVAKSLKDIKDLPNSSRGGQYKGRDKFTYDAKETMGDNFVNKFNNKHSVYVLGFDSYSGTFGRSNGYSARGTVTPPKDDSFENWIDKNHQFAFVDFNAFNKTQPNSSEYFNMSGVGHYNLEGKWNEVFNGIFFIRDIYPCETTP